MSSQLSPSLEPSTKPRRYSAGVKAALAMFRKTSPVKASHLDDLHLLTLALGNAGEEAAKSLLGIIGSLDNFNKLGSSRDIVRLRLYRVNWSTAVRCEVIYESSLRILGVDPERGIVDAGLLVDRKRRRVSILRRIAQDMRRRNDPLEASGMSDLELMAAYLESERAARTLLEALEAVDDGQPFEGSLLKRLDTIGSAETLINWGGIHLGTAARIEVIFEMALRIAGALPDEPAPLEAGQVFSNNP